MASKNLVVFYKAGGYDGLNFLIPRDAASQTALTQFRSNPVFGPPDFTESIVKTGSVSASTLNVVDVNNTTSLAVGMIVYSEGLPAIRGLTIQSIAGLKVTLSGSAYAAFTTQNVSFKTDLQLFKLNETASGRNLALNFTQKFMTDCFNTPDDVAHASKTKGVICAAVGPLRKKLVENAGGNLEVVGFPGVAAVPVLDYSQTLTSHNSQTTVVQAADNSQTVGGGGVISDILRLGIVGNNNKDLVSVSVFENSLFSTGKSTFPFNVTPSSLVPLVPGYTGKAEVMADAATNAALTANIYAAMQMVLPNDDFASSASLANTNLINYQNILGDIQEITDPPNTNFTFTIAGSSTTKAYTFLTYIKPVLRMLQANNPNRGVSITRTGNLATVTTESTPGVANRVGGSTVIEVTSANHRLFTSSLGANTSDSVLVLTTGAVIDTAIPASGYKVTLTPSDVDNKFTFTSTDTGALVNVPVSIQLKHNYKVTNKPFIVDATAAFDTVSAADGYAITSIVSPTQFTITTTASGAYTPATITAKTKLINLGNQLFYNPTPGIVWDSHGEANHSQLAAMDMGLTYFNSIASRLFDANIVGAIATEFGRTLTTNSRGTDHGWGNTIYAFGKAIKGNKLVGNLAVYTGGDSSPNFGYNFELPTTSYYQYWATFAKWLGLTDAQILTAFPDLVNWPLAERDLGFL